MTVVGPPPGATWLGGGRCRFRVWAPGHDRVDLHLLEPEERVVPLDRGDRGYHEAVVADVPAGTLYRFRLSGELERPDPASRHQPRGVHGPSAVVDPTFRWSAGGFQPPSTEELVLYELHVGTFTREGTLDAAIPHLDDLRGLGITAVELMPLAAFPGARNWGYDGAYPWAVHHDYGGPDGLRRFVQACHERGLAVHLDVVYNHLGPEGNYLADFAPYFTDTYRTPWGRAINFDGPDSDEVRRYFVDNALHWVREYRVDGLRLDAIHAIFDQSAPSFLEELSEAVGREARRQGRPVTVVGETHSNDARLVRPRDEGGIGLDAIWSDDLHHALHTLLTGEERGYYADYGALADLELAYRDRFAYAGRYSAYRRRTYGRPGLDVPADRFVVFAQNHDQVGNRLRGDRLSALVEPEALRLAAVTVLLSPYVPLLFMGEEYGETAPFPFFTSHADADLVRGVREGRKAEFAGFGWKDEPPDPQSEETFRSAKLQRALRDRGGHRGLLALHRELLRLRREHPAFVSRDAGAVTTERDDASGLLVVRRRAEGHECALLLRFAGGQEEVPVPLEGRWQRVLDAAEERFDGSGEVVGETLDLDGGATMCLGPWAAVVLERG